MAKNRDYEQEYKYHATPEQKKRRAERNSARAAAVKAGRVSKGDGKDVHHPTRDTSNKNTRIISRSTNRSHGGRVGSRAGKARGGRH